MDAKELRRIVKMLRLGNDITEYAESKLLIIADNAESKQLIQSCVVGQSEQCCEPIKDGFYLGTMCPKCNKPFRKNFK